MKKIIALSIFFLLGFMPFSSAANPKAGGPCQKLGATQTYTGRIFTCLAKDKLRIWDKGTPIQKNKTPHPAGSVSQSGSSATGTVLVDAGVFGVVRTISNNGGKSQPMECKSSDGNQGFRSQKTFFVDLKNPNRLGVGVEYKGFYLSLDAGATWAISSSGLIGYPLASDKKKPCHTEFATLILDPQDSNHLILSRASEPGTIKDYFSENAGLYESKNGGKSWKQILIQAGLGVYVHDGLAISHQNSQVIYAGTTTNGRSLDGGNKIYVKNGVIYKTTDGGRTWSELPTGAPADIGVQAITVDPKNDKIVTVSTFGRQKSTNGSTFGPGLGILKSFDGGATWKRIDSLGGGFSNIEFSENNPLNGIGITFDGNVLGTNDGGTTWAKVNGLFSLRAINYDLLDNSGSSGLIADESGTITKFTANGLTLIPAGSLPSLAEHSTRVTRLAISPDGAWYAAGHYTNNKSHQSGFIFKSVNSGQSWVKILDTDNLN